MVKQVKNRKKSAAKATKSAVTSTKVDYYPNRVAFLVAVTAVVVLFVLALMVTL